ncbi:trans-aconitate 2-methyltransferase [Umezawaea endophytica]|uniref:Trans-aconitate 2-methyltransferase n=1 Tax=Umezawaea endophytica TaxID=1654476 RepID=A0A9X2VGT6_9PSEU|nr:trans-aconitate 2-methyltransferase [Umezawaea endophytica]MCS7476380.1 trans-aconitate 2-methyltransferase [Umezawaea endophytica]
MWDPTKYLAFADHRSRPFHDLVARINTPTPRRVVDLGCGPGNLTETLRPRWPNATLEAFDSSPEMVEAARSRGLDAHVADATAWSPAPDTDVVITNAVLQWIPTHPDLLRRWTAELPTGAWLAMQVPGNFESPSHALVRDQIKTAWPSLTDVLRDQIPVLDPTGYADLLSACEVDAWETTYLHRLEGPDAILEWITGTALRPIRARLDDQAWTAFRAELAPKLLNAYPPRPDGTTWFPFRRVFAVARVL